MPLPNPTGPSPETQRNFRNLDDRLKTLLDHTALTGDRSDGTALANLIALLENKGILDDQTTA